MKTNFYINLLLCCVFYTQVYARDFYSKEYSLVLKNYTKLSFYKGIQYRGIDYGNPKVKHLIQKAIEQIQNFSYKNLKNINEKKAFFINAYNLYVIYIITKHYPVSSILEISRGKVFNIKIVKLNRNQNLYSLNEIEHQILRRRFLDPRIHFALVCAAISCPDIRKEMYRSSRLNFQLEDQTKQFLHSQKGVQLQNNQLLVSKIFQWYHKDFKKANSNLINYIKKYKKIPSSIKKIQFLPYHWDLNIIRYIIQ